MIELNDLSVTYISSGSVKCEEEAAPEDGLTVANTAWKIGWLE